MPEVSRLRRLRQNQTTDFAAADEAVVPAEVVVEHQLECRRCLREQRSSGAVLNLRLEAAPTERALDPAVGKKQRLRPLFPVGKKQRLRPLFLRARTFDAGNDPQREGLPFRQCTGQEIVKSRHHVLL